MVTTSITKKDRNDWLYLFLLVTLGLVLRVDFLLANNFSIDADEAIVGLMAKHIMEGRDLPVFYYGQHYMGSLEPLLIALLSVFTGLSNISVKLVPLVFSLSLIVLIYFLTVEVASRYTARLAALFFAVPPVPLLVWGLKARGGFVELIFLGALALLLTCYFLKKDRASLRLIASIGFVLGLGWWTNYQVIYFMIPIGIFVSVYLLNQVKNASLSLSGALQHIVTGSVCFIAGGAPFWIYNFRNNFVSFEMFGSSAPTAMLDNLIGFLSIALPVLLGGRTFWEMDEYFSGSALLVWLIYLPLFALCFWSRRGHLLRWFNPAQSPESRFLLIALFFIVTVSVFVASSYGYLVQAPRYLLPLYIALIIFSAESISYLKQRLPIVSGVFLISILAFNLTSTYSEGRHLPPNLVFQEDRVSHEHRGLIEWLKKENYRIVRTNYWIGNLLAFYSNEKVKYIPFQVPYDVRITDYKLEAADLDDRLLPLVLVPSQAVEVRRALKVLAESFEEKHFPGYVVIYNRQPRYTDLQRIEQTSLRAEATHNPEAAYKIADSDLETRWGSSGAQIPGMKVTLTLNEPELVRAIEIHLGRWGHDYPRSLRIDAELLDGTMIKVVSPRDYQSLLYLKEYRPVYRLKIDPLHIRSVHLTQLGADPVFDWSIAQVELYR